MGNTGTSPLEPTDAAAHPRPAACVAALSCGLSAGVAGRGVDLSFRSCAWVAVAALSALSWASAVNAQDASAAATNLPPWEAQAITRLGLDARQQAALGVYASAMASRSAQSDALTEDQLGALSEPRRLDWLADQAASDAATLRLRAEAARRFYATLTPEQQKGFDALMMPTRGRPEVASGPVEAPAPTAPDYNLPSHTDPAWLVMPTGDVLARVYPSAAAAKGLEGRAVLHCVVDVDGYLSDCLVTSETPPEMGFGNAALESTGYMRMKPATNYGIPTPSPINVPMHFTPP